jgi:hypothetical protein
VAFSARDASNSPTASLRAAGELQKMLSSLMRPSSQPFSQPDLAARVLSHRAENSIGAQLQIETTCHLIR